MKQLLAFIYLLLISQSALSTQIQGHRGSRGTHPENTIPAFAEALATDATVLEFDLGMSKDGQLVISHDPILNNKICRKSEGTPLSQKVILFKKNLKELKKYDCGAMINPRFPQQKTILNTQMPTLEEFFVWLKKQKRSNIELNIETKISEDQKEKPTASPKAFAAELARVLKKHNAVQQTVVQSFDFRSLKEIRKILPNVKISLLIWKQKWTEVAREIQRLQPNIISPPFKWLTPQIVSEIHKRKLLVIPWTVNKPSDWQKMIDLKVDGIITDYPRALSNYLKK